MQIDIPLQRNIPSIWTFSVTRRRSVSVLQLHSSSVRTGAANQPCLRQSAENAGYISGENPVAGGRNIILMKKHCINTLPFNGRMAWCRVLISDLRFFINSPNYWKYGPSVIRSGGAGLFRRDFSCHAVTRAIPDVILSEPFRNQGTLPA